ncbi:MULTISPECIES: S1C family serine protease [Streptacidiphilus]|uniref:S1C family serine protease n=1 Tax=Streptacidiphilus cavernicola TaxID=3342716 RepID=A0ABV6UHN6_9ACTN|nr:trypsin-like peptidase domain-containing protein [Streptacidiphilus jeojiense]
MSGTDTGRRAPRRGSLVLLVLVVVLVAAVWASSRNGHGSGRTAGPGGTASGTAGRSGSAPPSAEAALTLATVEKGLVDINVVLGYQGARAAATGMVLTPSGEVLTNNHVVNGATEISAVDVGDGRSYPATVVGYDRGHDLAVIQLKGASGLATVRLGDSTRLAVGDPVTAVGNAGGKGSVPTAAAGQVTGLQRSITAGDDATGESEQLTGMIQVDAAVQPGDSGGPLLDRSGSVVGVDTAASEGFRFRGGTGNAGSAGFATPIATARTVVDAIEGGRAVDGIHIGATAMLGLQVDATFDGSPGAVVAGVVDGSPAARAGLVAGDLITSFDGRSVTDPGALTTLVTGHRPGDRVTVQWTDQAGATHSRTVTLAAGPAD